MTFEEYMTEFNGIIYKTIGEYKATIKMEYEDLYQEACLLLFSLIDKLNTMDKPHAYFKAAWTNRIKQIRVEEHMQLLHITDSEILVNEEGDEISKIDLYGQTESDMHITDYWLENYLQHKRDYSKEYREEHKEEGKKYREEHKEQIEAQRKIYRERNKEAIALRCKIYYETHKDQILEYNKKYYEEHKEEIAEKSKVYREAHKEQKREYNKKWKEANMDKVRENRRKYKQRHKEKINEYNREYYKRKKLEKQMQQSNQTNIEGGTNYDEHN